ncbi:hypothetical protein N9E03_01230 [bacterium]|nr:hypothetical protein [bacterium]
MNKIINFFKQSYATDRMAFYAEIVETTVLIIASAVLSFTILDPATTIFVPLYLVGSILAVFSTYRRGSSAIVLCTWFTIMNSWAFVQLFIL